jgi:Spy/CpxP family protein refolding chaperone
VIRKSLLSISMAAIVILTTSARGQNAPQTPPNSSAQNGLDQDIELMRKDLRSQKKQIVAANLPLTDQEAERFWPLYDQYTAELIKINDTKYGALKEYAVNYNTLTDDKATSLTKQVLGVDQSLAQLRIKYLPMFQKVLSGKKTALFFQLDRRLVALIDVQLGTVVPVVQP